MQKPIITSTEIWANGAAAGDKVKPLQNKVDAGFIYGEQPPHSDFNWALNVSTEYFAELNKTGVPVWDSTTTYSINALAYDEIQSKIYRALVSNSNLQPSTNPTEWEVLDMPDPALMPDPEDTRDVIYTPVISSTSTSGVVAVNAFTIDEDVFAGTHIASDWEYSDIVDFSNIVYSSYNNTSNLVAFTPPLSDDDGELQYETEYFVRVRFYSDNHVSPWSIVGVSSTFTTPTTPAATIDTPTVTVQGGPSDIFETPLLYTSVYNEDFGAGVHTDTDWEVRLVSDNTLIWSLNSVTDLEITQIPEGELLEDVEYLFKARHNSATHASSFGEVSGTTVVDFNPPVSSETASMPGVYYFKSNGADGERIVHIDKTSTEINVIEKSTVWTDNVAIDLDTLTPADFTGVVMGNDNTIALTRNASESTSSYLEFVHYREGDWHHDQTADIGLHSSSIATLTYIDGNATGYSGTTSTINHDISGFTMKENDLVIVSFVVGSAGISSSPINAPAGYTEISDLFINDSYETSLWVGYKFMGSSPDTEIVFTGGTGDYADAGAIATHVWRGVDPNTPLDVTTVTDTNLNTVIPTLSPITPTTTGAVVLMTAGGAHGAGTRTFGIAGVDNLKTVGREDTGDVTVVIASDEWSSGEYTPPSVTFSGSNSTSYSATSTVLSLRPATIDDDFTNSYTEHGKIYMNNTGDMLAHLNYTDNAAATGGTVDGVSVWTRYGNIWSIEDTEAITATDTSPATHDSDRDSIHICNNGDIFIGIGSEPEYEADDGYTNVGRVLWMKKHDTLEEWALEQTLVPDYDLSTHGDDLFFGFSITTSADGEYLFIGGAGDPSRYVYSKNVSDEYQLEQYLDSEVGEVQDAGTGDDVTLFAGNGGLSPSGEFFYMNGTYGGVESLLIYKKHDTNTYWYFHDYTEYGPLTNGSGVQVEVSQTNGNVITLLDGGDSSGDLLIFEK